MASGAPSVPYSPCLMSREKTRERSEQPPYCLLPKRYCLATNP